MFLKLNNLIKNSIFLLIIFLFISCGDKQAENNELDLCKDITCSGFGTCNILNKEIYCVCDTGYTNGENNLECIKNTLECEITEHEEAEECVSNTKMVDCQVK